MSIVAFAFTLVWDNLSRNSCILLRILNDYPIPCAVINNIATASLFAFSIVCEKNLVKVLND